MYKVSQEVKNLFNKNYIQVADITVNGVNESFSVAENEIVQGSLSIDRYSVSNSKIEVGSAVAAELTLKLKNDDGKYDNTVFEGAEVFVKIGIKKWDAHRWENAVIHWIPCGYFTIDEPPRALSTITISALDRMILFDKTVDISKLSFPMTVADLLNKICTICGVTLATDITRLPNKDYQITAYPEGQDLTYRTLLQWCAALTGTCAFMNYDGNLELKWYEQTDLTISPSERYNSDMQENDVAITGIYFKDAANTEYIAGTDDYCLDLSSNGLLQDNVQAVLDTLYVSLKGFSYRPYTATIKSAPYIYPMDMIHYEDAKGEVHDTIITNVTFGMNLSTSIAGKGETTQKQKYSQGGGLTKQQATILEKLRENLDKAMTAKEQAQLELNRLLSNSLGLNIVTIPQDDGTQVYYFCDGETLESSNIIYTFKANGFAWTKSWNDGNPVWKYGFSKDGNAIYNMLAAYKISTEYLDAECVTAEKLSAEYKQSVTMATIIKEIEVDVSQLNRFAAIVAKQYDKQSRFLKVTLLDSGERIKVESASTAVINARREDEVAKTFEGTVNADGTVTVPLTYWMLQLDGTVKCDISIITANKTVLSTTLFELEVQEAAAPDDSEIEKDDDYGILIQLIADVQAIKDAEAKRVTAENGRVSAEKSRVSAENSRVNAETIRVNAEAARVKAEQARVSAENSRVDVESKRVTAEKGRVDAESKRVAAETARVQAETKRQQDTSKAITDCNTATDSALKAAATMMIVNDDTGKTYQGAIKVIGGKPVFEYDEVVTG